MRRGSNNPRVHNLTWWSAQQAADIAGVHTRTGEIPPYRAQLDGAQNWPVSVSFLLD